MSQRCQGLDHDSQDGWCGEIATFRLVFTGSVRKYTCGKYTCGNHVHLREYVRHFPSEVPIIERLIRGLWMTEADEVLRFGTLALPF